MLISNLPVPGITGMSAYTLLLFLLFFIMHRFFDIIKLQFLFFWGRVSLCRFGACPGTSSYRPVWPWTHGDWYICPQMLGLKACATTTRLECYFKNNNNSENSFFFETGPCYVALRSAVSAFQVHYHTHPRHLSYTNKFLSFNGYVPVNHTGIWQAPVDEWVFKLFRK